MATQDERVRFTFESRDKMSKSLLTINLALGALQQAAAVAQKALEKLEKAYNFAKAGAEAERLMQSGQVLASSYGQSMDAIIKSIQTASGETVDKLSAMSAANKAMVLDVAKTPAEFEKLTKAAVALGRATGRNATQAIEDLTTGIGRQSKLILDNLGIVYDAEKVYKDYAKTLGKSADQLTDYEKKQALVNIAIEKANTLLDENGDLVRDSASEYERLEATVKDVKLEQQDMANNVFAPLVRQYNNLADNRDRWREAVEKGLVSQQAANLATITGMNNYINLTGRIEDWGDQFVTTAEEIEAEARRFAPNVIEQIDGITEAWEDQNEAELRKLQVDAILNGDYALATALGKQIAVIETETQALEDLIELLDSLDGRTISADVIIRQRTFQHMGSLTTPTVVNGRTLTPRTEGRTSSLGGFADGGSFTVPSGFPNDSYTMSVQSGEHVKVTPAGQSGNADVVAAIRELKDEMYRINQELVRTYS